MLLHEILEHAAVRAPDAPALWFDGRASSFVELEARTARLAAAVRGRTAPGDRVAVVAGNRPPYVELLYGVPRARRALVPVNHRLHPAEQAATIARSGATLLVGERDRLDALAPHRDLCPAVASVVALDGAAAGETDYEDLLATVDADARGGAGVERPEPTDLAWLVFTSGTTGRPKGAMLTHASLTAAVLAGALGRPVRPDDVYAFPFPLCHVAAYNLLILHLHARPVVLLPRFEPRALLDAVARHRVTTVSLAPTMLAMLLDHPDLPSADLTGLRSIGYGASPIPGPLLRRSLDALGCDLAQGYGMTELSGNAVFLDAEAHRRAAAGDERLLAAAGWPSPLVAVRVVDDSDTDLPRGEVGQIVVRGDQVMAGYWDDPDATATALAGGWLHTGDLGRLDPDGLLTVVDREKDVIVTGGENVASRQVEEVLLRDPAVAEVAVVGVPDERWGESVCAVVVPRPGGTVDADALDALARDHLGGFQRPRHVVVVAALPKSASGKLLKREVRATASERVAGAAPDRSSA